MQLLADRSTLVSPGVCALCELTPDEGTPVLDTLRSNSDPIAALFGRKYVCFSCAAGVSEAFGFVTNDKQQQALAQAEQAKADLAEVVGLVAAFQASVVNPQSLAEPVVVEAPLAGVVDPEQAENVAVEEADEVEAEDDADADVADA